MGPDVKTNCVCMDVWVCVRVVVDRSPACVLCVQESLRRPCHMINVLSLIIYVLQNMMYVRMNFEL